MTPEQYKEARKRLGTQAEVAEMLGVSRQLLSGRENGKHGAAIDREAVLAMELLLLKQNLSGSGEQRKVKKSFF